MNICKLSFFPSHGLSWFPFVHLAAQFFLFVYFLVFVNFFYILMVIISLELTRINHQDQNIFSIKCGTNIYFIYSVQYWDFSVQCWHFSVQYRHFSVQYQHFLVHYRHFSVQNCHFSVQYWHFSVQYRHFLVQY